MMTTITTAWNMPVMQKGASMLKLELHRVTQQLTESSDWTPLSILVVAGTC
jgi:hypothetical protein